MKQMELLAPLFVSALVGGGVYLICGLPPKQLPKPLFSGPETKLIYRDGKWYKVTVTAFEAD
jgi:hypothetical protein